MLLKHAVGGEDDFRHALQKKILKPINKRAMDEVMIFFIESRLYDKYKSKIVFTAVLY